jgi:hypothetical protein
MRRRNIILGIIPIVTADAISPYRIACCVTNCDATTFIVTAFFIVNSKANRYSDHVKIKHRIPAATKPGLRRGSVICLNTPNLSHPSVIADSSISDGISSTKLLRTKKESGILKVV